MDGSKTSKNDYSLWGLIGLETMGEQPRANETMFYLNLNGNKASVNHYLKQQMSKNTHIKTYTIKENGDAEIVFAGNRRGLADELRMFGISPDEISLTPPMKNYDIPISSVGDGYNILGLAGNGTTCTDFGDLELEIQTDMFSSKVARKLGCRESEIHVSSRRTGKYLETYGLTYHLRTESTEDIQK